MLSPIHTTQYHWNSEIMISNLLLFFTGPPRCSLDCLVSPPRLLPPDSLHRPTGLHRRPGRATTFYSEPRQNRDLVNIESTQKRQIVSHGIHVGWHVHLKRHLTSAAEELACVGRNE